MADDNNKPKVIIFGGCGFVGRNLVEYLISNDLVSTVRVIDKVPPQIAWLNKKQQKIFDDPRVEYKSANLILPVFGDMTAVLSWPTSQSRGVRSLSGLMVLGSRRRSPVRSCRYGHHHQTKESCENAFADGNFDCAVNCACETKLGQTDPVYKEGVYKVSINCATAAAKHGVKRFVEVSSGKMASSEKTPHKESDPVEPWTSIARFKLQVEEQLKNIPGLKYTIIRPAIVYGIGDRNGLAARLVLGGVYRHLGESMKLLWSRDLVMNTVHVHDLVRAIWYLVQKPQAEGQIYNVADDNHTTQGTVTDIISEIFNINHDYYGNILSTMRKNDLGSVVEEVNDKHLGPWAEACQQNNVENTPLSPYIHQELLDKKHLNLNTDKLKNTGFTLTVPTLNKQLLQEMLDDYVEMNLFPRSLIT